MYDLLRPPALSRETKPAHEGFVSRQDAGHLPVSPLLSLAILAAIYFYLARRLYSHYQLAGDDPASVGGSLTDAPFSWFTNGMRGYFHVYPEWWQGNFSNFYRPVWNLVLYNEKILFGGNYFLWFALFYAVQFLGSLLFLRLLATLGAPRRTARFFGLLFLLNPAFICSGLLYPGFQSDVFTSVLLLAALFLLVKERPAWALLAITLAIFTKESALFAPVSAAMTVLLLKRNLRWATLMLVPLFLWAGARWLVFGTVAGGTFASPASVNDLFAILAKSSMFWPSGALDVESIRPLAMGHLTLSAEAVALLSLAVNLVLWVSVIYAAVRILGTQSWWGAASEAVYPAILLTWMLGALSFCLLAPPQIRYGACLYTFTLLFWAHTWRERSGRKTVALAAAILAGVTIVKYGSFLLNTTSIIRSTIQPERALYAALAALPQDGRRVYVFNAPAMWSAPNYLAVGWQIEDRIIFINQFIGCPQSGARDWSYRLSRRVLTSQLPSCAANVFSTVGPDIIGRGISGWLRRPGIGSYHFPNGRTPVTGKALYFGRELQFEFDEPDAGTMLVYDWRTGDYRPTQLPLQPGFQQALAGAT